MLYILPLHDALPISSLIAEGSVSAASVEGAERATSDPARTPQRSRMVNLRRVIGQARPANSRELDRKSTRLNSSHPSISYAVFCLKKKIMKLNCHE